MYLCTFFNPDLERIFTTEGPTVKEAVTECWRLSVSASCGEDASTWDPDDVRVSTQTDVTCSNAQPLPDHTDEPLVIWDLGRMTYPSGFVVPKHG